MQDVSDVSYYIYYISLGETTLSEKSKKLENHDHIFQCLLSKGQSNFMKIQSEVKLHSANYNLTINTYLSSK